MFKEFRGARRVVGEANERWVLCREGQAIDRNMWGPDARQRELPEHDPHAAITNGRTGDSLPIG